MANQVWPSFADAGAGESPCRLAVRTPGGAAAADPTVVERGSAARAGAGVFVAVAGQPVPSGWHPAVLDGLAEHSAHRGVQPSQFSGSDVDALSAGMDACPPEDLVGQQVAEAGDEFLVDQRRLDGAAQRPDDLDELLTGQVERVRSHAVQYPVERVVVAGQPDALQFAHVAVTELAVVEGEHDSVVLVPAPGVGGPGE